MQDGSEDSILPPVLSIWYAERPTAQVREGSQSEVSFRVIYEKNLSG